MKVLIVEDSIVVRQLLRYILEQGGLEVIGEANDGEEALEMINRHRPDVITMDVHLPKMDGFECTRRIMESDPIPIVVVTGSYNISDSAFALRLLEAGAVTVVEKPLGMVDSNFEEDAANLIRTVRNIGEVKLVRRIRSVPNTQPPGLQRDWAPKVVAIGASTGEGFRWTSRPGRCGRRRRRPGVTPRTRFRPPGGALRYAVIRGPAA